MVNCWVANWPLLSSTRTVGEGEGSRGGGGALDPTGGCLHGQARREGAGDLRPGVGGHAAAREQTDLVRDPYGAVAELVGAIGDHQWARRIDGQGEGLGGGVAG